MIYKTISSAQIAFEIWSTIADKRQCRLVIPLIIDDIVLIMVLNPTVMRVI